jgi:hypothetical protein
MAINPDKLVALMGKLVGDLGAMLSIGPMMIGEKLGLYKAMADGVPINAPELAARTNTDERYVREWLCAQAYRQGRDPRPVPMKGNPPKSF